MAWTKAAAVALAVAALAACGASDPAKDFSTIDPAICNPGTGAFSATIDNAYLPMPVGRVLVLEGNDGSTRVRVRITVLDETQEVAGVTTRVVEEAEYEDDELIEVSRNFFAQASDGTVCYLGEDVDIYEGGAVTSHGGAWRAGDGANAPGILMPGAPTPNKQFAQESAPGVAEDMSAITEVGVSVTTPAGTYADAVHAIDWNPLEGETSGSAEDKYFARGIGLVVDDKIRLTSQTN